VSSYLTYTEIRTAIASALVGIVGTYTYSNGATASAFWVTEGPDNRPEQPNVTGIEAVLSLDTSTEYQELLGGEFSTDRTATLTLYQWDVTASLRSVERTVLKALRNIPVRVSSVSPRLVRDVRLQNLESQVFLFAYQSPN
jgi:hypothetical protein